jgi:hypothetical protein
MDGTRIRRMALGLKFKGDKPWGGPGTARYSSAGRGEGMDEIGNFSLVDLCETKMMIHEEEGGGEYKKHVCCRLPSVYAQLRVFHIGFSFHQE